MTTLPIEHAWLTMATGLHIHVHFLWCDSRSLPLPDTTRGGVGCEAHSHAFTSFC
jgi:hypothetical protein